MDGHRHTVRHPLPLAELVQHTTYENIQYLVKITPPRHTNPKFHCSFENTNLINDLPLLPSTNPNITHKKKQKAITVSDWDYDSVSVQER